MVIRYPMRFGLTDGCHHLLLRKLLLRKLTLPAPPQIMIASVLVDERE
jgi:hypothetical protein